MLNEQRPNIDIRIGIQESVNTALLLRRVAEHLAVAELLKLDAHPLLEKTSASSSARANKVSLFAEYFVDGNFHTKLRI